METRKPARTARATRLAPLAGEHWHIPGGGAIREVVFGMNDGLVSTLAFVSGVTGALASSRIVVITGLAATVAGAISMALGAYIASKSQQEFFESEIQREKREMAELPEEEREEVRQLYQAKGFSGPELEMVVHRITSNPQVWLKVMMEEELGLMAERFEDPRRAGGIMGISFILGAMAPLLPYFFFESTAALLLSFLLSLATLFGVGVAKTRLTLRPWLPSGLEMLAVGAVAFSVSLGIGKLISLLLGIEAPL